MPPRCWKLLGCDPLELETGSRHTWWGGGLQSLPPAAGCTHRQQSQFTAAHCRRPHQTNSPLLYIPEMLLLKVAQNFLS